MSHPDCFPLPAARAALACALGAFLALGAGRACAEGAALPLWEVGAGAGAASMPTYPGADQSEVVVLPIPYVIYRGEFFQADREGMRARFLGDELFDIDVSFGFTPPVQSGDSDTRQGMPDLSAALEFGPELRLHIARAPGDERTRAWELNFNIPVRHSLTYVDDHFHSIGNVAYPHFAWKRRFEGGGEPWELEAELGAYFNDRDYHRYFYEVLPRYATPTRRAYDPQGGFGGWEAGLYASRNFGRLRVLGALQVADVSGAAFASSPLVRRDLSVTAGLALAWVFWTSDARAP